MRSTMRFEFPAERGPQERHRLYRDMGLRVTQDENGNSVISGALDLFI